MNLFGLAPVPLLAVVLTACTTPAGTIGIERKGEHIHAVVATCPGHTIDHFRLTEQSGPFDDEWDVAPGHASADLGVFDDTVTATATGNPFSLSASSSTTADTIAGPTFTSDDLAQLDDGWVLIHDPLDQNPVIFVSKDDFDDTDRIC